MSGCTGNKGCVLSRLSVYVTSKLDRQHAFFAASRANLRETPQETLRGQSVAGACQRHLPRALQWVLSSKNSACST